MPKISYVYPNVSSLNRNGRGGLTERYALAQDAGCDYVEVPADFIKNKTEIERTGLSVGDFLSRKAISVLYRRETSPSVVKYIMHTEPALTRSVGDGRALRPSLNWYDGVWVNRFTHMLVEISQFLGTAAAAIEIHPGGRCNSFADLVRSMRFILQSYRQTFNTEPPLMVENRTGQMISTGRHIRDFWAYVSDQHTDLAGKIGIVLDVQQLYTVTKSRFLQEFGMIPDNAIRGLHIHHKHQAPELTDVIPWKYVFQKIKRIGQRIIINPEILHQNKVQRVIAFCETLLARGA